MLSFAGSGGSLFPPDDVYEGRNECGQTITLDAHSEIFRIVAPLPGVGRGVNGLKQAELQLVKVEG